MAPIAIETLPEPTLTFEPRGGCKTLALKSPKDVKSHEDSVKSVIQETVNDLGVLPATITPPKPSPALFITGLGSQYPPFTFKPDRLEPFLSKWYDPSTPSIKKLLQVNQTTLIQSRSTLKPYEDPFWSRSIAPTISELDRIFRKAGVDLTVQACKKALRDAKLKPSDITHTVAVTCTNAGNPGFDLLVADKLGLSPETDRTLLHGVGCAGGLSAMRAAAALAQSYSLRGRPARILCFACEICSVNVRADLEDVVSTSPEDAKISPVLFSDAAASFVLCNELAGASVADRSVYELVDWETCTIPRTAGELEFVAATMGWKATLTRQVPQHALAAIGPMFQRLLPYLPTDTALAQSTAAAGRSAEPRDFDWALHPGGIAILNGVEQKFELKEEQLRASYDVYKNHGNSSSPTVLVVLDQLRKMGAGRDDVMACSFGPGMTVEMCMMRRVRKV
ncbi:MAG: hypothetical protein LQ351_002716 [Letrouitia transgressa]|nr:MAG: hypothetical protein LQ351_002716 [Letrouitia transgressa]